MKHHQPRACSKNIKSPAPELRILIIQAKPGIPAILPENELEDQITTF
jgi:hypothetical protein